MSVTAALDRISLDLDPAAGGDWDPAAPSGDRNLQPLPRPLGRLEAEQVAKNAPVSAVGSGSESATGAVEAAAIRAARRISLVSLTASLVVALLGLGLGAAEGALALIGFGIEALLDGLSSALVLWRFKKPKARDFQDEEAAIRAKEARDMKRERKSSIGIGGTFVLSGVLLVARALRTFTEVMGSELGPVTDHEGPNLTILLALPSAAIFGALAYAKFRLAEALKSQVIRKDALCSVLGTILALICTFAAVVEEVSDREGIAEVDAVASCVIGLILFAEGIRTLWHNLGPGWAASHRTLA